MALPPPFLAELSRRMREDYPDAYALADEVRCSDPDSSSSPGAQFLSGILETLLGSVNDLFTADEPSNMLTEMADGLVPSYASRIWEVFTDLGAYDYDNDYGLTEGSGSMTRAASVILYSIASDLVNILYPELERIARDIAGTSEDDDDEYDEYSDEPPF